MKNDSLFWKTAVVLCLILNATGWYIAASRSRSAPMEATAPDSTTTPETPTNTLTVAAAEAAATIAFSNTPPARPVVQDDVPRPPAPQPKAPPPPLLITGTDPCMPGLGDRPYLDLRLNAQVRLEQFRAFLSIDPACDFTVEKEYYWSPYCIHADFQPGKSYRFTLRSGMAFENNRTLEKDLSCTVTFPDRNPSMAFPDNGQYLPPNAASAILRLDCVNLPADIQVSARRLRDVNIFTYLREVINTAWWRYRWGENSVIENTEGLLGPELTKEYKVADKRNEVQTLAVDLREILPEGPASYGTYLVKASCKNPDKEKRPSEWSEYRLVILSDIGLTVRHEDGRAIVWATSAVTGKPLPGVQVRLFSRTNDDLASATTGEDGTAELPFKLDDDDSLLFATGTLGDDITFLKVLGENVVDAGARPKLSREPAPDAKYEAYLFAGRDIVRPGETLPMKLVVRDLEGKSPSPFPVTVDLLRPDFRTASSKTVRLSENGTAEAEFSFEPDWPTGYYRLRAHLPGSETIIGCAVISMEEIVPPQIKVQIKDFPEGVLPSPTRVSFGIVSEFLFGAPASGLPFAVEYTLRSAPFKPKGWDGYRFGDVARPGKFSDNGSASRGSLDESGSTRIDFTVPRPDPVEAMLELAVAARVQQAGGRTIQAFAVRQVSQVAYFIGLKPQLDGAVKSGEQTAVDIALVTPDGDPFAAAKTLEASLEKITRSWNWKRDDNGDWRYVVDVHVSSATNFPDITVESGAGSLPLVFDMPGEYRLRIRDAVENTSTTLDFDVISPTDHWSHSGTENPIAITLTPDREFYAPGDTVCLTAKAPFPGEGMLFLEGASGRWSHRPVSFEETAGTVSFEVAAEDLPSVRATLVLLRPVEPQDCTVSKRMQAAHRAVGTILLSIRKPERALAVELDAPEEILPQSKLRVSAKVLSGETPVEGAEVTFAAVDEGLHMLTDFTCPDPLAWANAPRWFACEHVDPFSQMLPVYNASASAASHIGGDGEFGKRLSMAPSTRRFRIVALWKGTTPTGADGMASTEFDVPEFTGSLRVMAIAIAPEAYGSENGAVAVRRPVNVIPTLPRFAAPGDAFDVTVELFNSTSERRVATLSLTPPAGGEVITREVALDAGARAVVTERLVAPTLVGEAPYVFRTTFDGDALPAIEETVQLPVRPAAAYSHVVKDGVLKPGETVDFAESDLAGLLKPSVRLCVSRRPEAQFGSALEYLVRYPYGCVEQTTSASFPMLYLEDIVATNRPDLFAGGHCREYVQAGISRILAMQRARGGFSYWADTHDIYDWGSLYATHFLLEAKKAGYDVPEKPLRDAVDYVAGFLTQTDTSGLSDPFEFRSYAAHLAVLGGRGTLARPWLDRLLERHTSISSSARAHTAAALIAAGRPRDAAIILSAGDVAPKPDAPRVYGQTLSSPVRDMALVLSAQCDLDPDAPLAASLAGGILSAKTFDCRWGSTQENAMALMALGKYYRAVFKAPADAKFAAEILRPGLAAAETADLSSDVVWTGTDGGIRIRNAGEAPFFYSVIAAGVPSEPPTESVASHMKIRREFLDATTGKPIPVPENGPIAFAKGDCVAVRIVLDTEIPGLDQVVVSDLLPAGLEIENPRLATSAQAPQWVRDQMDSASWVMRSDIRDDRLLLFTGTLHSTGPRTYIYLVRAVTTGEYVLPAVAAEAMYDPTVRARAVPTKVEVRP